MTCVLYETPLTPSEEEVKITTTEADENNYATEVSESEHTQHPVSPYFTETATGQTEQNDVNESDSEDEEDKIEQNMTHKISTKC